MSSESAGNKDLDGLHINYYGLVLDCLRKNTLCREISELGELVVNPPEVGLTLALEANGLIRMKVTITLAYIFMNLSYNDPGILSRLL